MFFSEFEKFCCSHHSAVFAHDFAAETAFFETCYLHEIHCCFSVTVTFEYTTFACFKWEHVTWTSEVFWFSIVFNTFDRCDGTFHCRDTCCCFNMVNRNSESSTVIISVFCYHLIEFQLMSKFFTHWHTNQTFGV